MSDPDEHPRDWTPGVVFMLGIVALELALLINNTGGVTLHLGTLTVRFGGFQ